MSKDYFTTSQVIRLAYKYNEYVKNSNGRYVMTYPGLVRFFATNGLLNYDKCVEFVKDLPKNEWEGRKDL